MALLPTTELDAINSMLATLGEAPYTTLVGDLTGDVANCQNTLHEVSRDVQTPGWSFNTRTAVTLTPDGSGYLNLPNYTISVEVGRGKYPSIDPVQRGTKLFDRKNNTAVFTTPVELERVVTLLDFADLPESCKRYVFLRACRVFQSRFLGSSTLFQFSQMDEVRARTQFLNEEARVSDRTAFNANSNYIRWR